MTGDKDGNEKSNAKGSSNPTSTKEEDEKEMKRVDKHRKNSCFSAGGSNRSVGSESSLSSSSSHSLVRRKEEYVYIPYSYQVEQNLMGCMEDKTPIMLRSEKAQMRQQQKNKKNNTFGGANLASNRLRRFANIICGYFALFSVVAIHSYMTWRDDNYHPQQQSNKQQDILESRVHATDDNDQPSLNNVQNAQEISQLFSQNKMTIHKKNPVSSVTHAYKPGTERRGRNGLQQMENNTTEQPFHDRNTPVNGPRNSRPFPSLSSPLFFDAIDSQGQRGYVADPAALRRFREEHIARLAAKQEQQLSLRDIFWQTLAADNLGTISNWASRKAHIPLTPKSICSPAPTSGDQDDEAYKLFARKIQVAPDYSNSDQDVAVHKEEKGVEPDDTEQEPPSNEPLANNRPRADDKLLCAIYADASTFDLARTAALTWGYRCDGFLIFGDAPTIPELGFVQLEHNGPDDYGNLWQKVRSIWAYLHHNYLQEYQYFHLGGDDMYVIPENLKWRLSQMTQQRPNAPIFMGQQLPRRGYIRGSVQRSYRIGGPGYTLNRKGLQLLVEHALPDCRAKTVEPYDDRLLVKCLNRIGYEPTDGRDPTTGEQTYHGVAPHTLYSTNSNTDSANNNINGFATNLIGGTKQKHDSVARYSVSFHNLFHPIFMTRVHTLLYPDLCAEEKQQDQDENNFSVLSLSLKREQDQKQEGGAQEENHVKMETGRNMNLI